MGTQWRTVGGFGRMVFVGLDYGALPIVLQELEDLPQRRPASELMPMLRVLEHSARSQLNAE